MGVKRKGLSPRVGKDEKLSRSRSFTLHVSALSEVRNARRLARDRVDNVSIVNVNASGVLGDHRSLR
jgi:hypothetical protein